MRTVTLEPLTVCVGRAAPRHNVGVVVARSASIPANGLLAVPPDGTRPPMVSPLGTDDDPAAAAALCWARRAAASAAAARASDACAWAPAAAPCCAAAAAGWAAAAVGGIAAPVELISRPSA